MAFVPGFEHDLFISYAHRDDEPLEDGGRGWVSTFRHNLENALSQKLEGKAPDIWMDQRLALNAELGPELTRRLERTAVLLVILSPPYVTSKWCQDERRIFIDQVRSRSQAEFSVFVIEKDRVIQRPEEFAQRFGLRFWKGKQDDQSVTRTFGWPDPNGDTSYWDAITTLACKIADSLRKLSEAPSTAAGLSATASTGRPPAIIIPLATSNLPAAKAPAVLVAHSTDDLCEERMQVVSYLEQAGFIVLPAQEYPDKPEEIESLVQRLLPDSALFVQLLGRKPGRWTERWALGMPGRQYELALQTGIPALQWRDPTLVIDAVTGDYRKLLDGPHVYACGLEEFKSAVVERARQPSAQQSDTDASRIVLINAVEEDAAAADELAQWLSRQQVDVVKWVDKRGAGGDISRFAKTVGASSAFIVVCGQHTDPPWLFRQVKEGRKYGTQHMPSTSLAVYDRRGKDEEMQFSFSGLRLLDCRSGLNEGALKQFVATLGG